MNFVPSLKKAILVKRYKRFLADVILEDGSRTTIHVANTGAMTGCATPNDTIWYSTSDNPKRKYPYSWELTQTANNHLICVNTLRANQLVKEAIINGKITEFLGYSHLRNEVKYGNEKSKIDFLLIDNKGVKTYIEVKSVTLLDACMGYFPDSVTTRGQKHLRELMEIVKNGDRAVLLFAVLHSGINCVQAAKHIDPVYSELLEQAQKCGVEILAYKATFLLDGSVKIILAEKILVNIGI